MLLGMWQVPYNIECDPDSREIKRKVVARVSEALIVRNQKRER